MTNLQYFKQLNAMLLSYKEGKTQSNDLLVGVRMLNLEAGDSNLSIKLVDPQTELERLDATKQLELQTISNPTTEEDEDEGEEEEGIQESYKEEEEENSYSLSYEEEEESSYEESYEEEEDSK